MKAGEEGRRISSEMRPGSESGLAETDLFCYLFVGDSGLAETDLFCYLFVGVRRVKKGAVSVVKCVQEVTAVSQKCWLKGKFPSLLGGKTGHQKKRNRLEDNLLKHYWLLYMRRQVFFLL